LTTAVPGLPLIVAGSLKVLADRKSRRLSVAYRLDEYAARMRKRLEGI
jgi:hypothetical protein